MTRRERLIATLQGKPVDRPAVNFYEISEYIPGFKNDDPFNIYNDPSWEPLLQLAWEQTDIIRRVSAFTGPVYPDCINEFVKQESYCEGGSVYTRTTINAGGKIFTSLTRRDPDVDTVWTLEHLLKDADDLRAYLQLPDEVLIYNPNISAVAPADAELGDRGIVMIDMGDPICWAAPLFSMEDYTVIAFTEPELFHELLEKIARCHYPAIERLAGECPGCLWRICGAEYATEPYLPPKLFEEYVVKYTGPIVKMIQDNGGYARIHCHGRIEKALPYFISMGASAIDPVEPPPQGNVQLADVRREYGRDLVLFGNLEVSDIENMDQVEFKKVVSRSLRDGTSGEGRGFVLMPSAAPYGRKVTARTMANYETIVELATRG